MTEVKKYFGYGHITAKIDTFSRFRELRGKKTDDTFLNELLNIYEEKKDVKEAD
jgi:hypothetical protein